MCLPPCQRADICAMVIRKVVLYVLYGLDEVLIRRESLRDQCCPVGATHKEEKVTASWSDHGIETTAETNIDGKRVCVAKKLFGKTCYVGDNKT